ncbi:MAG: Hsp33 family molecular chaperone HslO [Oscillospiraceae bacterium]|nr:Hsp33 family molecular chaperone HslO [Oscillospiraceae bacterium]
MGRIIRAVAGDDFIKICVIEARDIVERARQIHKLSPTATAALGRTLCAVSMMGNMLKEEKGSITARINGGGILGGMTAVADSQGNVRGYAVNPSADLPLRSDGKLDVGGIVGTDGLLTISRDIGLREPYIGSTKLLTGEIGDDFAAYYAESEQIGAACGLGVLVDTDITVRAAGGFIVQLLPGAPDEMIEKIEDNIFMMDQLTTILDEDGVEEVIKQVLKGFEPRILEEEPVEYRCYCSRERVADAIASIGTDALAEIVESGEEARVGCQFCDEEYVFAPEELKTMLDEMSEEN